MVAPGERSPTCRRRRSSGTSTATTSRATGSIRRGRRSTGARSVGERGERVRAGLAQRGVPGRRGLELRAEPGRGVGRGLPAHGRAQGRDHDGDVADHRAELLSRTRPRCRRPSRTCSSRGPPRARGSHDVSSARRRQRSGGSRSRRRSTETSGSARRFRTRHVTRSRSSPPIAAPSLRRAQWVGQRVSGSTGSICGQRIALRSRHAERALSGVFGSR